MLRNRFLYGVIFGFFRNGNSLFTGRDKGTQFTPLRPGIDAVDIYMPGIRTYLSVNPGWGAGRCV